MTDKLTTKQLRLLTYIAETPSWRISEAVIKLGLASNRSVIDMLRLLGRKGLLDIHESIGRSIINSNGIAVVYRPITNFSKVPYESSGGTGWVNKIIEGEK